MVEVIKGKYRIVREIARSNDIVYEAVDTTLNRRIALKELNIPPSLTGQARRERIERFYREARAAGRLSHPNIVSVFECGEENGRHFIAMEFLEGQTLRDAMLARGSLPVKEAVEIACQVLDALGYAHANRVIHRDIKPDNIQMLPGGQVKLTDFGIARLTEEANLTGDGQVFGTPSYMSPEQVVGKGIDHRSDLFSLAVVLYEMLAGRKPFTGDSVVSITYAIMHAPPPPLPGAPPAVEQVILRALSKDPHQRQTAAEQLKRDLRAAEQMPISQQRAPTQYPHSSAMQPGYYGGGVPVPPPFALPGSMGGQAGSGPQLGGYVGGAIAGNAASAPQQAAVPGGALPWAWSGSAGGSANSPNQQGQSGQSSSHPLAQASPHGANAPNPFGQPPFPRAPAGPIIELSPGAKSFLVAAVIAVVLGSSVALGAIAFLRSYDRYRETVAVQRVIGTINAGVAAYNAQDYAKALALFEQALAANPSAAEKEKIQHNLWAAAIQLAREAVSRQDWQGAKTYFQRAIQAAPERQLAHLELAPVLERLGDRAGSLRAQEAARSSDRESLLPSTLENAPLPASQQGAGPEAGDFIAAQRGKARQLIQEGDALFDQGDREAARQKWREAVSAAPGTPERDEAQLRLDRVEAPVPSNSRW